MLERVERRNASLQLWIIALKASEKVLAIIENIANKNCIAGGAQKRYKQSDILI